MAGRAAFATFLLAVSAFGVLASEDLGKVVALTSSDFEDQASWKANFYSP
jgi:hypothetical protein